jgi:glucan phosphorylase
VLTADDDSTRLKTIHTRLPEGHDCFHLDLSNNTVYPNEVEQILRHRQGFFYARNRTDLKWVRANWDDVVKWDSLQKVYLY